jgi:sialate O-acetylesterase
MMNPDSQLKLSSRLSGWALAALFCALASGGAAAQARLAGVFGDHMVLQRDAPIRVWGWAAPGETVRVALPGRQGSTKAQRDGRWAVLLPALPAGGPHALTVRASNTLVLQDVMVGELWLCSGQSNMEWPLRAALQGEQEVAASDHPVIRHLKIAHRASLQPADDMPPAAWQVSGPATAGEFSAAAYFFAVKLQRELGVTVGLINASWGGTHLETWTSPRAALRDPDLAAIVREMPANPAAYAARYRAHMQALVGSFQGALPIAAGEASAWAKADADDRAWPELEVPRLWEEQGLPGFDGWVWYRRRIELSEAQAAGKASLHLGTIDDCDETYVNGQPVGGVCQWDAQRSYELPPGLLHAGSNLVAVRVTDTGGGGGFYGEPSVVRLETAAGSVPLAGRWKARVEGPLPKTRPDANDAPTLAFNGMLQPLLPLRIRGVLWYQGESNVPRAERYAAAFQRLITDWRAQWGQGRMPFYFVQLASFLPLANNSLVGSPWAELRDAQRQALVLRHTGMVVATDVGDANDIHPRNKQAIGERLALLALHGVHGRTVADSGPVWSGLRRTGARLELSFTQLHGGLRSHDQAELQGFAIADSSRQFHAAKAEIVGSRVRVWSLEVSKPVAVRYGWVDNPEQGNLVNGAGLPASPFRTDHWPWVTKNVRFSP